MPLSFESVAGQAGFEGFVHHTGAFGESWFPETVGPGVAVLDYDDDGAPDVLVAAGGAWPGQPPAGPAVRLYAGRGDGTFEERTEAAGLGSVRAFPMGLAVADYDNDGDDDVFLTTLYENILLRNDAEAGGTRRFTDVSAEAGVADLTAWSTSALFFDADRDGHLDLYVGNYVAWTPETDIWCTMDGETKAYCTPQVYEGVPGRFYRNQGDGTFREATAESGLTGGGKTLGVAMLDVNGDLWPDLAVANDTQPDLLYVNDGDGTFTEQGAASGIAYDEDGRARAGMGIDAGDLENEGEPSIVVGNFANEMIGVYRHLRGGVFLDRAASSRIGQTSLMTLTFGLFLFDVDFDGDLDLFAANGHIDPASEHVQDGITYRQPAQLFLNDGSGTFAEVGMALGGVFEERLVARGAAYGDLDGDLDLDILVAENGGSLHVWTNGLDPEQRADLHALRVHLEGRESNRDGLGARLTLRSGSARQQRLARTGSSYLSQSERVVTFGLGDHAAADSLIVEWPSGQVDVHTPVPAGTVKVVEGADELTYLSAARALARR